MGGKKWNSEETTKKTGVMGKQELSKKPEETSREVRLNQGKVRGKKVKAAKKKRGANAEIEDSVEMKGT